MKFALLVLVATALNAAPWAHLETLSELGRGVTPGVAAAPDGTLHVIFMQQGRIFHRSSKDGRQFSVAEEIPAPAGETNLNSPHVVCDRDGIVHLVFGHSSAGNARRAWYTSRHGGAWRAPLLVLERNEPGRRVNYPRLALAGDHAFIGAFTAGGSTIVRVAGLSTVPRVDGSVETRLWVAHPFVTGESIAVVGRAGASGHHVQRFSDRLEVRGKAELLSHGTPTKTFEALGATMDETGVIHVVGAAGSPAQRLWYTTTRRAARGDAVLLGPELGHEIKEYTYPCALVDGARERVYVSYREHPSGEGKITCLIAEARSFESPLTIAPAITQRLRWNAPLALGPDGTVFAVWDDQGTVFLRRIRPASGKN